MKPKVIVIGAGVTGLSAAFHLAKTGEFDIDIFEKTDRIGGLATSFTCGKAIFDFGPHAFHSQQAPLIDFFTGLMGPNFNEINKDVAIKFEDRLYPYPLNPTKAMMNMPLHRSMRCAFSYVFNLLFNHKSLDSLKTSEEFFVRNFGWGLYRIFFEGYTHKVWGIHPRDLSVAFIRNRLPPANIIQIALNALTGKEIRLRKPHEMPLKLRIFYPKKGSIEFPLAMAEEIKKTGGQIHTDSKLKKIIIENGRVSKIEIEKEGRPSVQKCEFLISTIPITELVSKIQMEKPPEAVTAYSTLFFRPILIACLWIDKPQIFPYQTIYYTNRVFNRLAQMNSYSADVAPSGTSGITAEMTCRIGDELWNLPDKEVLKRVIADMEKEGLISAGNVKEGMVVRNIHGYPIYHSGFEPHLNLLRAIIRGIPNLFTGGRQGMFNYAQMHYGVTSGQMIADAIFKNSLKSTPVSSNTEDLFFT